VSTIPEYLDLQTALADTPDIPCMKWPRYYCPGAQAVAHRLPNFWDGTVLDGELTAGRFEAA